MARPIYYALHASLGRWSDKTSRSVRMWHCIIERACVYYHICSTKGHGKAVRASRSRPVKILTINVIVRTVTGALEASAVSAERVCATEMDTALVEGNPVRAISPLDKALRTQLICKISAA